MTLGPFLDFGSLRVLFGFGVTLGPFWVSGLISVHSGSEGHFGSILSLGVNFGPFWVWGSLSVRSGSVRSCEGHFEVTRWCPLKSQGVCWGHL